MKQSRYITCKSSIMAISVQLSIQYLHRYNCVSENNIDDSNHHI